MSRTLADGISDTILSALDTLLGSVGEAIVVLDESGNILFATRLAEQILDISSGESPQIRAELSTLQGQRLSSITQATTAFLARHADGRQHVLRITPSPDGRAFLLRDLHSSAQSEAEQDLLDVVAHDLRAGMVPAKTYAQMLLSSVFGALNEKQADAAKIIDLTLQKQADRIANVLDLIKAEQNRLELQLESANLLTIIQQAAASLERDCKRKGVELVLDLDQGAALIDADVPRLQRVLVNLLQRALKETAPKGTVGVELRYVSGPKASLRIWDTGGGSALNDRDILLSGAREQAQARMHCKRPANIELGAVFDIVRGHRGELQVQTGEGAGTTCLLYFPVHRKTGV